MEEGRLSLEEIREICGIQEEEAGYDAPFVTFTWAHWQELQVRALQGFTRFQRAIEHKQSRLASVIALEMQQLAVELHQEACAWTEQDNRKK